MPSWNDGAMLARRTLEAEAEGMDRSCLRLFLYQQNTAMVINTDTEKNTNPQGSPAALLRDKWRWVDSDRCWWWSRDRQTREHLFKECLAWKKEISKDRPSAVVGSGTSLDLGIARVPRDYLAYAALAASTSCGCLNAWI